MACAGIVKTATICSFRSLSSSTRFFIVLEWKDSCPTITLLITITTNNYYNNNNNNDDSQIYIAHLFISRDAWGGFCLSDSMLNWGPVCRRVIFNKHWETKYGHSYLFPKKWIRIIIAQHINFIWHYLPYPRSSCEFLTGIHLLHLGRETLWPWYISRTKKA